jgi:predicted N-formylglutamate amidohydrolase
VATHERCLVLSCEHGGNRIPAEWASLFRSQAGRLESHNGWDPGALSIAKSLASRFGAPLVAATTSRLLVDLNRSPHNPSVFSKTTQRLPRDERATVIERVHRPHWERFREVLDSFDGPVLHIAVHSFTPVFAGRVRAFDLALLYDPAREPEREFAATFKKIISDQAPWARLRRNAPYRGNSDGLTTAMRRERSAEQYLGIELELNQASIKTRTQRSRLVDAVSCALRGSF